jgi:hypothetical protein
MRTIAAAIQVNSTTRRKIDQRAAPRLAAAAALALRQPDLERLLRPQVAAGGVSRLASLRMGSGLRRSWLFAQVHLPCQGAAPALGMPCAFGLGGPIGCQSRPTRSELSRGLSVVELDPSAPIGSPFR